MSEIKIIISNDPFSKKSFAGRVKAMYDNLLAEQLLKWKEYDDRKAAYDKEWLDYNNLPWHKRWNTPKPIIHSPYKPSDEWGSYDMIALRQLYAALQDPDVYVKEIGQEVLISLLRYEQDQKLKHHESYNPL